MFRIDEMEQSTLKHYEALAPYIGELFGDEQFVINSNVRSWIEKNIPKTYPILDYGAGDGNLTIPLIEKGFNVDFYEPSDSGQSILKTQLSKSRDVLGNFYNTKQYGKTYGLIIIKEMLYHVLKKENRQELVIGLSQCLAAGGCIVIIHEFLDEKYYSWPKDFVKVSSIKGHKSDVFLRRKYCKKTKISKTEIQIRGNTDISGISVIPPAYFAFLDFDDISSLTKKANLRLCEIYRTESIQKEESVTSNGMYLMVFRKTKD